MRIVVKSAILLSLIAWMSTWPVQAAVNSGDKPKLEFEALDGTLVSLEDMKGKLVLVEFWATWCHVCMEETDHMAALHKKYEPQGLRMIGISLDQDRGNLETVVKEKNLAWPHHFHQDGKNPIALEWDIPHTAMGYLISPSGVVLWKGHVGIVDRAIEDALRKHPPTLLDKKTAGQITAALDQIESALKANDHAAALSALAKLPPGAAHEKPFSSRVSAIHEKAELIGNSMLSEAEALVARNDHVGAAMKLHPLAAIKNIRAGRTAHQQLAALLERPEVKARVEAAAKSEAQTKFRQDAQTALESAQKLQREKKDEEAYLAFKSIIASFKETPAASAANHATVTYEKDPAFMRRMNDKAAEGKAKGILALATSLKAAGKPDLARQRYQSIIDQFPNTTFADTAKREMADLKR